MDALQCCSLSTNLLEVHTARGGAGGRPGGATKGWTGRRGGGRGVELVAAMSGREAARSAPALSEPACEEES